MAESLTWDAESANYVRARSQRYPAGVDLEPEWATEVMEDPELVAFEPDPKSRIGASRFIGWSPTAARVLVLIAYRDLDGALHGLNAWPASGADLAVYEEGVRNVEDY